MEKVWADVAENPFLWCVFIWTGFDYRGSLRRMSGRMSIRILVLWIPVGFPKTIISIKNRNGLRNVYFIFFHTETGRTRNEKQKKSGCIVIFMK